MSQVLAAATTSLPAPVISQLSKVAELKDSTRYERTLALLQKYDPGACMGVGRGLGCITTVTQLSHQLWHIPATTEAHSCTRGHLSMFGCAALYHHGLSVGHPDAGTAAEVRRRCTALAQPGTAQGT